MGCVQIALAWKVSVKLLALFQSHFTDPSPFLPIPYLLSRSEEPIFVSLTD